MKVYKTYSLFYEMEELIFLQLHFLKHFHIECVYVTVEK